HNADRYRPRIVSYARQKTGLDISIGRLGVGLFPLTVRLYDVEIKNPKPFPAGDFLKAPMVEAVVDVGMLFHRKVAFHSIVLDKPAIDFISDPDGLWNFQNPATPKQAAKKSPRFSMGTIAKVEVKNGVLLGSALIDPADTPGPVVFEVRNFSGEATQIHFNAFKAPGSATAIAGHLKADAARFGDVHVTNVSSDLRIRPAQLTFKGFHAKTYRGQASGDFTFNFAGKKTKFATQVQVSGIGPGYLLKEFVSGPEIVTGMMKAEFKLAGEVEHTANPLAGIDGGGRFTIGKGELPGLDRNSSMVEAKRFRSPAAAGMPPSAFSSFAADMELKNHRIYSRQIRVDFYGVDARGAGDMNDLNSTLNYHGTVIIEKKQGFFTTSFARIFKGAREKDGRLVFPIRLTGTWADPRCTIAK
ncbi:MAG TPA: AsmA family protein, partial [Rhizomicrobium sp.]